MLRLVQAGPLECGRELQAADQDLVLRSSALPRTPQTAAVKFQPLPSPPLPPRQRRRAGGSAWTAVCAGQTHSATHDWSWRPSARTFQDLPGPASSLECVCAGHSRTAARPVETNYVSARQCFKATRGDGGWVCVNEANNSSSDWLPSALQSSLAPAPTGVRWRNTAPEGPFKHCSSRYGGRLLCVTLFLSASSQARISWNRATANVVRSRGLKGLRRAPPR